MRVHMSNVMNTPSEVIEGEYPIRVEEHALRRGLGRRRGRTGAGLGFRRAYRILATEVTLASMLERRVVRRMASPAEATARRSGSPESRPRRAPDPRQGDGGLCAEAIWSLVETCGGGGYGPLAARLPEALGRDI